MEWRTIRYEFTAALAELPKPMIASIGAVAMRTVLDMEGIVQALAGNSEELKEGAAAFFEKRTPKFQGR